MTTVATRQAYTAPTLTPCPLVNSVLHGDALEALRTLPDNSVDAVVTDPPYGLGKVKDIAGLLMAWVHDEDDRRYTSKSGFMGKAWDYGVPGPRYWKEVYRVMKPGAHLLAFGGTRTYDLLVIALRLSGFECRNLLAWIHGQGFPKSLNIGKATRLPEHEGMGTDLKPALEPICLARKPLAEQTIAANVLRYGTGGLNIDATRIGGGDIRQAHYMTGKGVAMSGNVAENWPIPYQSGDAGKITTTQGRFPSNTLFSHTLLCEHVGTKRVSGNNSKSDTPIPRKVKGIFSPNATETQGYGYADSDGLEEVDAWECHKGGMVTLPCYEYKSDVLLPLSEPSHLLGQLASLLHALSDYSKSGSIPVNSGGVPSDIVRILLGHCEDAPLEDEQMLLNVVRECVHALDVSRFVNSLYDCPSCLRLCGEYLHRVAMAYQDGLPSLHDALGGVHSFLSQLEHNQHCQTHALCTQDDLRLDYVHSDMPESKKAVSQHSLQTSEIPSYIQYTLLDSLLLAEPHDSTENYKTDDSDSYERCAGSSCRFDLVRLLMFLSLNILSSVLPIGIIQQKRIDINSSPCPVYQLSLQSGQRKSGGRSWNEGDIQHLRNTYRDGTLRHGEYTREPSEGTAARYFAQFAPDLDDLVPFVYQSKPSRKERTCNGTVENTHPTLKSLNLMNYLVTMITPPGGIVLDMFAGSGSTLVAAVQGGYRFIGIEAEAEYVAIAEARLRYARREMHQ